MNFIFGLIGILIGLRSQPFYYNWDHSFTGYYIAGLSLLPIVGSIIELKNTRIGCSICLISGIILIAISMFPFWYASIPFFFIIEGSFLGLTVEKINEKTGEIIRKEKEFNGISVGLSLLGGSFGIMIAIVDGIVINFTLFTIIMIIIGIIPWIGAIIKYYTNLFIRRIIFLIIGIILFIMIIVQNVIYHTL